MVAILLIAGVIGWLALGGIVALLLGRIAAPCADTRDALDELADIEATFRRVLREHDNPKHPTGA